jgi:hypothetical protein
MIRKVIKLFFVSVTLLSGTHILGCSKKDAETNQAEGISEVGPDGKPIKGKENKADVNQHANAS